MKLITTEGYWNIDNEQYLINMSSIYTALIQHAGRFCEDYASDLLYDIAVIDKTLKEWKKDDTETNFYLGIRAMGVDGVEYIRSHIENSKIDLDYYYRAMFILHIHRDAKKMTAELKRVDGIDIKRHLDEDLKKA